VAEAVARAAAQVSTAVRPATRQRRSPAAGWIRAPSATPSWCAMTPPRRVSAQQLLGPAALGCWRPRLAALLHMPGAQAHACLHHASAAPAQATPAGPLCRCSSCLGRLGMQPCSCQCRPCRTCSCAAAASCLQNTASRALLQQPQPLKPAGSTPTATATPTAAAAEAVAVGASAAPHPQGLWARATCSGAARLPRHPWRGHRLGLRAGRRPGAPRSRPQPQRSRSPPSRSRRAERSSRCRSRCRSGRGTAARSKVLPGPCLQWSCGRKPPASTCLASCAWQCCWPS
jgi:hypothetical protein